MTPAHRPRRAAPLLRGRSLDRAHDALGALSVALLRVRPCDVPDVSLAGGLAGIALAHATLDGAHPDAGHGARAMRRIVQALGGLGAEAAEPGLFSGLAGVGWTAQRLAGPAQEGGDDLCAPIDRALTELLDGDVWAGPFDLVNGLVGIGVYALERAPRASGRALLARVIDALARAATRRPRGLAWWTDPRWHGPAARREHHPDWHVGVAHGAAGVIALLARAAGAGLDAATSQTTRALLDGAVAWLLDQELSRHAAGCFAWAVAPGIARAPARLSWCAGDVGTALAILGAGRALNERTWERAALRVGLRAAAREEASAGVVDAGLCHGAAGVAHGLHRLYRETHEARFADAARRWFDRALALRVEGRGVAGFRAWDPDPHGTLGWRREVGFLTGAAGVALALHAATTGDDPSWDRALLLS